MYNVNIPYPLPFDHDAARHEERRRLALKTLSVGDVLAELDDLVRQEADEAKHPCAGLAAFLLDQAWSCDGGQLFDAWKALTGQAIDRLVEAHLRAAVEAGVP